MRALLLITAFVAGSLAMYPNGDALYEDILVEDLYKRLSQLENNAIFDDMMYNYGGAMRPWDMNEIALESRESGHGDLRDHEYLEHSSIGDGFQYISGGAGEGKQHLTPNGDQENIQEVKSDEELPFYCHPPNPCPKGKTAEKDGCHEFVKDSAEAQQEWILKMQSRGMCACDEEHMFKCPSPAGGDDMPAQMQQNQDYLPEDELDQVLDRLLGEQEAENPFMIKADKRDHIGPKKIRMRRDANEIDNILDEMQANASKRNPYQEAPYLKRVSKKG